MNEGEDKSHEEIELEMEARKLIDIEKLKTDKPRFKKVWSIAAKMLKEKKKEINKGELALDSVKPSRL